MRIEALGEADCSGCHACANACGAGAISMQENREGFLYPAVDHALCIGCEACDRACPKITPLRHHEGGDEGRQPDAYAAICRNPYVRDKSSSGGYSASWQKKLYAKEAACMGQRLLRDGRRIIVE